MAALLSITAIKDLGIARFGDAIIAPPTVIEKGYGIIANTTTTCYIPTKLKIANALSFTALAAAASKALFTTVAGWICDLSTVIAAAGSLAQAGGTVNSIILKSDASAVDDAYNGLFIDITHSDGAVSRAKISDYTGSTKKADLVAEDGSVLALKEVPGATTPYAVKGITVVVTDPATTTAAVNWKLEGTF